MFKKTSLLKLLLFFTIVIAFLVRLYIFIQARDLFIDEANVARNIHEKNYIELTGTLDYEQYAPPLFLLITKFNAEVFAYHEMALRLFPFLCGIASIFLLAYWIHLMVGFKYAIYPIALFAGGYLFLRYGTELKQYSSDFMVTLLLLIAAFKHKNDDFSWKQIVFWTGLGSVSIWLSMPSVFVLFSIGAYWIIPKLRYPEWRDLKGYFLVCGAWFIQFALYYFFILQSQASSDYLQNYHAASFLNFEFSLNGIVQNLKVLSTFISQSGGSNPAALIFNSCLLLLGFLVALEKLKLKGLLLLGPLALLILAAILHKYALVARLLMFAFPIIFGLYAIGLSYVFKYGSSWIRGPLLIGLFLIPVYNFSSIAQFKIQEIHYALDKLESEQLLKNNDPIWVHHGAIPAFKYYTEISDEWQYNFGYQASLLTWDTDYNRLVGNLEPENRAWILLTNYFPEDEEKALNIEGVYVKKIIDEPGCLLFQIEKK